MNDPLSSEPMSVEELESIRACVARQDAASAGHARWRVNALLAEVERLRAEVERLRAGMPEITDEMVERAAVGIFTTSLVSPTWAELDEDWRDHFRTDARAALTAVLGEGAA